MVKGVFSTSSLKRFAIRSGSSLLQSDLHDLIAQVRAESRSEKERPPRIFASAMSASFRDPWLLVEFRPSIGRWLYGKFHLDDLSFEEITTDTFLSFRESLVNGSEPEGEWPVEFNAKPFLNDVPLMTDKRQIGQGVEYLNRTLSNHLFSSPEKRLRTLFEFLRLHHHEGKQLMLSDRIREPLRIAGGDRAGRSVSLRPARRPDLG